MKNYELARTNAAIRRERMRAARLKGTHTKSDWKRLKEALGNCCVRCGATNRPLQKDHIVPIYRGGSDSIQNIQPLCLRCNCSKGPELIDHRNAALLWWEIA